MIARAPWIAPGVSDALVHVTDVFATVLDLAGLDPGDHGLAVDGTSLGPTLAGAREPPRRCMILEQFAPNGDPSTRYQVAALERGYTLVRRGGSDELYQRDPSAPVEGPDLLESRLAPEDRAAVRRLRRMLRADDPDRW